MAMWPSQVCKHATASSPGSACSGISTAYTVGHQESCSYHRQTAQPIPIALEKFGAPVVGHGSVHSMRLENVCSAIARALRNAKCNSSCSNFYDCQAATEMASTNETSAPGNPHNSFVVLETFLEDALVYQPFVSEVRFEAGLNQRRGCLNKIATVAPHLLSLTMPHASSID